METPSNKKQWPYGARKENKKAADIHEDRIASTNSRHSGNHPEKKKAEKKKEASLSTHDANLIPRWRRVPRTRRIPAHGGKSRRDPRDLRRRSIYRSNGERTSDYRRLKSADVPSGSAMRLRGRYRKAILNLSSASTGLSRPVSLRGGRNSPVYLSFFSFLFFFFFDKSVKS